MRSPIPRYDFRPEAFQETICGACGKPWNGQICGQAENGWEHPVCYPVPKEAPAMHPHGLMIVGAIACALALIVVALLFGR